VSVSSAAGAIALGHLDELFDLGSCPRAGRCGSRSGVGNPCSPPSIIFSLCEWPGVWVPPLMCDHTAMPFSPNLQFVVVEFSTTISCKYRRYQAVILTAVRILDYGIQPSGGVDRGDVDGCARGVGPLLCVSRRSREASCAHRVVAILERLVLFGTTSPLFGAEARCALRN
jgi:hypothetical protein